MKVFRLKRAISVILGSALILGTVLSALPSAIAADETIATNGNGGKTDVGAWYTTYNTNNFWGTNGRFSDPENPAVGYKALRSDGTYGLPNSGSADEIDFQLEKMAEAGIDFIVFDLTNGGLTDKLTYGNGTNLAFILNNAKLTCERIAKWNENHRWQIKYAVGVGVYEKLRQTYVDGSSTRTANVGEAVEAQAQAVKEIFIDNSVYGKYYYELDGKPLLVIHELGEVNQILTWNSYTGTRDYGDLFTVRGSNSRALSGSYGWYTGGSTADNNNCGAVDNDEVMLVCPGQWNHSGSNPTPAAAREDGAHYTENWNAAIAKKPRIVMISSLNDYMEDTAVWPTDTSSCTVEEHWITEGKEDSYKYWNLTVDFIARLRSENGDTLNTAEKRTSENLILGMTAAIPNYSNGGIANLTDGNNLYASAQGYVLYGAGGGNTNAYNETYYQFDFGSGRMLNNIKLYLSKEETKNRPRDIAVDVKLLDGTWLRTAARYDISYTYDNITVAKDGAVQTSRLEFVFPAVECTAFRITSNRQRTRNINASNATYNWRLTEIEAYYTEGLSDYTGIGDPDNVAYVINPLSESIPSRGRSVTTNSIHGGTKGLNLITNNVWSGDGQNEVLIYFNSDSNTVYLDIQFEQIAVINRAALYQFYEWTGSYLKRNPRDIAIDVLTADGEYVRVAEKHNIEYSRTSSGFAQTDYYFPAMLAAGIRVTYNKVQDGAFINGSTPLVSPNEIQADYKSNVTTSMYTGIEGAAAAGSVIPRYASKNYALGAGVTTSGRENTGNTASNLTDGKTTNRGISYYGTSATDYKTLNSYDITLEKPFKINRIDLYQSQYDPEHRTKDFAIDILTPYGSWQRVAECHNYEYSDLHSVFTFMPVTAAAIRITANINQVPKLGIATVFFALAEVEAYYDPEAEISERHDAATVAGTEIPYYASENLLTSGSISSSNTNATLNSSYPAANLLDGKNARNDACGIINYTNGIAWYRVNLADARSINSVKLYLSQYEPEKAPQDIGIDVFDGSHWLRAAEIHNICYGVNNDGTLKEEDRLQEFAFAPITAYAIRITAANARNSADNFRAVEIEAYFDENITDYTGVALPDRFEYIAAVKGDVNNDLIADSNDLSLTRKALLGEKSIYSCDANYDGKTDIRDLIRIKTYIADEND